MLLLFLCSFVCLIFVILWTLTPSQTTNAINSLLIYELGKHALEMIEPRYEHGTEHAGIYGNPEICLPPGTITLTESVEILTTPFTYCHQWKGGRWGSKSTQQVQMVLKGKLHVHTQLARKTLKNPLWDPSTLGCFERLLARISSTQTLLNYI